MALATVRFDPRFRPDAVAGPLDPARAANADRIGAQSSNSPRTDDEPPRSAVEAALARIVESRTFAHSERHRVFLAYVTHAVLDGQRRRLKEVVIGLDVFGRSIDGYDPRRDSIVRVEARRLRQKLDRYYATEGRDDRVRIHFEPGNYAPSFATVAPDRSSESRRTIVAMPFRALDDAARPLAVGLADHLADALGAIDALRVIVAPNVAARPTYRMTPAVARQHAVDLIVDGSVATSGSRLRCVAHVTRSRDDVRLWSQAFEFDVDMPGYDVFAAQDRIVGATRAAVAQLGED